MMKNLSVEFFDSETLNEFIPMEVLRGTLLQAGVQDELLFTLVDIVSFDFWRLYKGSNSVGAQGYGTGIFFRRIWIRASESVSEA